MNGRSHEDRNGFEITHIHRHFGDQMNSESRVGIHSFPTFTYSTPDLNEREIPTDRAEIVIPQNIATVQ